MTKNNHTAPASLADQRLNMMRPEMLKAHPKNPNKGDVGAIIESIKANGFYGVIIAQKGTNRVLVGEHRWRAAVKLKLAEVPVMVVACDDAEALRIMLADNRTAELAHRDPEQLAELLRGILEGGDDLTGTGYDADFLDDLTAELAATMGELLDEAGGDGGAGGEGADLEGAAVPDADKLQAEWGTARGQIWSLTNPATGTRHLAGAIDSTSHAERAALIEGAAIKLGLHDPPYGIGKLKGAGWIGYGGGDQYGQSLAPHRVYSPVAGDDQDFDPRPLRGLSEVEVWWGSNWFADKLPPQGCFIVWDKRGDLPSNSFADCEIAWVNSNSPARMIRHRWFGFLKDSERGEPRMHPTQKPVAVQAEIIEMFTEPGDTVLDLYAGSGPTLLAAHHKGRRAIVAEMSPAYLAVILERGRAAGLVPQLIATLTPSQQPGPAPEPEPTPEPSPAPAPKPGKKRGT